MDPPNLAELAPFISTMSGLGMQWFPDPELEKFLREIAHLPELPEEVAGDAPGDGGATNAMEFMGSKQKRRWSRG